MIETLFHNKQRIFYMDYYGGHQIYELVHQVFDCINTELNFLPNNSIDLVHPTDVFVIQKINESGGTFDTSVNFRCYVL